MMTSVHLAVSRMNARAAASGRAHLELHREAVEL